MTEQEAKRYLFIGFDEEDEIHDFLVNWNYHGYFAVEKGIIIHTKDEDLRDGVVDAFATKNYGILIPLGDYAVVSWDYRTLSKKELKDREMLPEVAE